MLLLQAQVLNKFETPTGVNRETGEQYGGQDRVQLLHEETLRNGETRMSPIDLTTSRPEEYEVGSTVQVPVRVYPSGNGIGFAEAGSPAASKPKSAGGAAAGAGGA